LQNLHPLANHLLFCYAEIVFVNEEKKTPFTSEEESLVQRVKQIVAKTFELRRVQDTLTDLLENIRETKNHIKRIVNTELGGVPPPPYASPFYGREWLVLFPLIVVILGADFALNYKAFTILEGLPEIILYIVTLSSVVVIAILAHHIAHIIKLNHLKNAPIQGTEKKNLLLSCGALILAILALTYLRYHTLYQKGEGDEGSLTLTTGFVFPLLLQVVFAFVAYLISYHYIHPTASLERKEKKLFREYRNFFNNFQSGVLQIMNSEDPENRLNHHRCFQKLLNDLHLVPPQELEEKDPTLW